MKPMDSCGIAALLLSCASILTSSCVPFDTIADPYPVDMDRQQQNSYYVPAAPHIPLLAEQHDINFNLLRASGNNFNGAEVQAAYMPWKSIALGAAISVGGNRYASQKTIEYNRFEFMSGYVKKIDKTWFLETYAGLGTGRITNYHYTGGSTIKLGHYFFQPAIGAGNKKKTVQVAFASRFAGVNFTIRDTLFSTDREQFSAGHLNSLYDQPFHLMWEPSLLFRVGWKNILFTLQYNHSADLTNSELYRSKDNFSFGVSVRGNTKMK